MLVNPVICMQNYNYTAIKLKNKNLLNNTSSDNNYISNYSYPVSNISFKARLSKIPTTLERFKGCILGGAIGDALGAPVEFKSLDEIKKIYGKSGIKDLQVSMPTGLAEITDDTQMTIFTLDGLLRGLPLKFNSDKKIDIDILYDSYKKWYETQTSPIKYNNNTSWIYNIEDLYIQKEPGNTCLSALMSNKMGTVKDAVNNSKGSGCIMRVAPIGLLYHENPKMAFELGMDSAALTHGNPLGYLAAGYLSSLIAYLTNGEKLSTAINKTISYLKKHHGGTAANNLINKIKLAENLAKSNIPPEEAINRIGNGWNADEALSLALYCAIKKSNGFKDAVRLSVNHSGDSDTVGAITGNIMGCITGEGHIPSKWINLLQLNKTLSTLATDLYNAPKKTNEILKKYPFYENKIPKWYNNTNKKDQSSITNKTLDKVKFSKEDELLMQNMTIEERIKYKQMLIKKNLFEY